MMFNLFRLSTVYLWLPEMLHEVVSSDAQAITMTTIFKLWLK